MKKVNGSYLQFKYKTCKMKTKTYQMVWTQQNIEPLNSKTDLTDIFQTELYQEKK